MGCLPVAGAPEIFYNVSKFVPMDWAPHKWAGYAGPWIEPLGMPNPGGSRSMGRLVGWYIYIYLPTLKAIEINYNINVGIYTISTWILWEIVFWKQTNWNGLFFCTHTWLEMSLFFFRLDIGGFPFRVFPPQKKNSTGKEAAKRNSLHFFPAKSWDFC